MSACTKLNNSFISIYSTTSGFSFEKENREQWRKLNFYQFSAVAIYKYLQGEVTILAQ